MPKYDIEMLKIVWERYDFKGIEADTSYGAMEIAFDNTVHDEPDAFEVHDSAYEVFEVDDEGNRTKVYDNF